MTDKEILISWINLLGVKTGDQFKLSSGIESNTYIDMKSVFLHNRVHKLLANLLCEEVKKFAPVEAVAGVALGGCHLASIVAMVSPVPLDVMYIRKNAKEHGMQKLIERPNMFIQQEVVLLEDVITTGKSAVDAADLIVNSGFIVKGIISVVDRREQKVPYLGRYPFSSLVDFEELNI